MSAHFLPRVLIPYDQSEALTVTQAGRIACKSAPTIRAWASNHDIGRRVGGGPWLISGPALLMFLDGDADSLRAYLSGDRESEAIREYFDRAARKKEKR